jgi:hypothetical protein
VRSEVTLSLYPGPGPRAGFIVPQRRLEPGTDTFRLGPLPPGVYDLLCDPAGRARLSQRGLSLAAGQTLELPPFGLDTQKRLHLDLRHADGRPATGAVVQLTDSVLGWVSCAETTSGKYQTVPALPGTYTVAVRGPDFAPFTKRVELRSDSLRPTRLTVPVGEKVELYFYPRSPVVRWIAAMKLHLRDAGGGDVINESIQIDGEKSFALRIGLRPGRYTLVAKVYGGGRATSQFVVRPGSGDPQVVDIHLKK